MSHAGKHGGTPHRWPSIASRTPARGSARRRNRPGLLLIDLGFLSPDVTLRHKRLTPHQTQLAFALSTWLRTVDFRRPWRQGIPPDTTVMTRTVCRCLRSAWRSPARTSSMNAATAPASAWRVPGSRCFAGTALTSAWRRTYPTVNTKLPATPAVSTGHQIHAPDAACLNKSTLALQSTPGLPIHSGDRRLRDRGWAKITSALLGQISIAEPTSCAFR